MTQTLKQRLAADKILIAPGVYDPLTALIAPLPVSDGRMLGWFL
jgi:2-methylisocitrate lyase-like PEP mutase family enzyme